jgi:hypothetical protein
MKDNQDLIARVQEEQRELKARLRELRKHTVRSTAEQVEYELLAEMQREASTQLRGLAQ